MSRPPLANIFAVSTPDASLLASIDDDLTRSGEFAAVSQPAPGWVAAVQPLPGSETDRFAHGEGLVVAEGQDVLMQWCADARSPLRALAEKTDSAPEELASVPGDFGFIRLRGPGSATVVRSCGGLVPLYLCRSDRCVAIASRLGDLVRYLPDDFRLDPLVNAIWTTGHGFFPDGRTFVDGIRILSRGHFARIEPARDIHIGRYWNPRPKRLEFPSRDTAREHAARLRSLLIEKMARDLDPHDGNLLTLSGGVDSSSLAAVARGVVGRNVWTLSILPAPAELFAHEMSYIEPLAQQYGFERRWTIQLQPGDASELLRSGPPAVFHVIHPALCVLPRIAQEAPVRVLFGGEFADEVCGSGFTLPDWAASVPLWRLPRFARSRAARPLPLHWARERVCLLTRRPRLPIPDTLPDFIHPEINEEYRDCFQRIRQRVAQDRAPWANLSARCESDAFVAMNWEAASAVGVRRSFPFFNREVLELAFQCHPTELIGPGYKKLLRGALRDDVPPRNINRSDKGGWGGYLREGRIAWNDELPEDLRTVIRPEWFPSPRQNVGQAEAFGLTELAVFSHSFQARRAQRHSRQGQPRARAAASS